MKMSNPFVFPKKTNKNPRNAFDLSHHEYFTTSLGLLEPSLVMDLIPGDYVEITPSYFHVLRLVIVLLFPVSMSTSIISQYPIVYSGDGGQNLYLMLVIPILLTTLMVPLYPMICLILMVLVSVIFLKTLL